ncbi:zinc finger protein 511 [Achroia grisella]|uniref:zinc finger protein 511 n=1 Tax=Achroia grisella TaxID=688607 RepID=UPI0027D204A7|nr:zinc finger protein 511 [Achroia grisella]XP_059053434.1 zinc finger protein 511 [Achroia grisella]
MMMDLINCENIKKYGVGRRKLDDVLFASDKPPPRLGVYDLDEENLCHEVIQTTCNIPGCTFIAESILDYENHYNASHRYTCTQCKKVLPSPHLLDLHIQERHDSFFAVMAEKKPSYCCYIEECKEKFKTADERLNHCVKIHKLPKDFRYEQKTKIGKKKKSGNTRKVESNESMDTDGPPPQFSFTYNKKKAVTSYTGRQFTKNSEEKTSRDVDMDEIVDELKKTLPD